LRPQNPTGRKSYWDSITPNPEFVLLPGEAMQGATLQQGPGLFELNSEEKMISGARTTVIALLKAMPDDRELKDQEQIEHLVRVLVAAELNTAGVTVADVNRAPSARCPPIRRERP
jgi:hypothetical protein